MQAKEERYDAAVELQQNGQLDEAIAALEQLVEDHPDYALAYSALSAFYGQKDDYEKAIPHAQKVVELEPEDPFSFTALSMICQKADKRELAEEALMQAQQLRFAAMRRAAEDQDES